MQTKTENKEKDPAVCRTCLTPITGISFRLQEQSGFGKGLMFTHILRYIVPELYLGLSHGPEICYDCKESLRIAYAFRKRCLETEALIGDYLKTRRCTAQAIELSSVIEYVKQFKGKLDAQSILSEWTEDSIEDFPQTHPTDGDTRQGSKLEIAPSETIMNPAQSQPLPDPNANSILSSASSRQVIRKIRIPKLTKPSEPSEIAPPQPTEANKENKTGKKQERVEVLKVCPKTGLFKNKAGKYLNLQGEELTEAVVEDMNTKQLSKPKDIDNQNKVESPTKVCKKQTSSSNIVIENSMDICEETGLLRDQNGHYFDFSGNPLEEEQVKEEKRKAKIRGENLFKISNICTVTDAEFENKNKTSGPADFEDKIEMYQIAKQDTSNNNAKAQPDQVSHELIKELQKPLKHKEIVDNTIATITPIPIENQGGNLFGNNITSTLSTILSSPVNILNFQADENLRIPQQWNPIIQPPKSPKKSNVLSKKNVYKVKKIVKETDILSNTFSSGTLFRISNPITGSFLDSLVPNISTQSTASPQSTSTTTNTLLPNINQTTQSGLFVNSISNYIPVRIKQEPADEPVVNSTVGDTTGIDDNEDTLSAPDLSLDDTSTTTSWQNLINSLDTCETSQYIDVPDFVQIQNFSIDDLLRLRKQKRSNDSKEKSDSSNVAKSNNSQQLSLLKSQKKDGGLPDQFIYRGKLLVKTSNGYKFDENHVNPVQVAGADTQQETNATSSSEPMKKIKRKLKIASFPQRQKVTAQEPLKTERDKELCVLFTNYTYDGMYINDHDYLTSPYVRNKLLFNVDKKRYCMCYICGLKHLLRDHVSHMNSHRSTCPCCSIDLGTSYMLNLHMKNHSKPCKYCTETIPYPLIPIHLSKHTEEEVEYEEVLRPNYRRRRGRPRNDPEEEERFHGVFSSRGRRKAVKFSYNMRETRSSGRSDESPVKKYIKLEDPLSLENCSERKIRGGRRRKDTSQNRTVLNNPYVLLERVPDDLINDADVQKIIENYENSSDYYPVAIAESAKIKIETDDEEAFNENKSETNVDVISKKRRGRPEKRFKLYRETKAEKKPQTRVLRSSFRKKEETEIRVSESDNDIEYKEERGKVKQSVETVADKTQVDEKSVDKIDACAQTVVSEESVDNESPADGKSEDKTSVESDNADEKSVDKTPVEPVDKETFAVEHSEAKPSVETVEKETPADEKSVEPVDNETAAEEKSEDKTSVQSVDKEASVDEKSVDKTSAQSVDKEASADEKSVDKTSVQSVDKEASADEKSVDKTSVQSVDKEASVDEKSVDRTSVQSVDNETPADDKPVDEVVSEEKLSTERVSDPKSLETSNTDEQSLENPVAVENPEREVTQEVQ